MKNTAQSQTWKADVYQLQPPPPGELVPWLQCCTSITERARAMGKEVKLDLLREGWDQAAVEEARLLNSVPSQSFYTREILMYCDQLPSWYARSVMPELTYRHWETALSGLGDQPLGNILYSEPSTQRSAFQYHCLSPTATLREYLQPHHCVPTETPLWARRSLFSLQGFPLLLQEIFLPTMPCS